MFIAWVYRLLLLLFTIGGLLIGWSDYQEKRAFQVQGRTVKATPARRDEKPGQRIVIKGEERFQLSLEFSTEAKAPVVVSPFLSKALMDRLQRDGYLELSYLPDTPRRIKLQDDELPTGYPWLAFGLLMGVLFAWSLKAGHGKDEAAAAGEPVRHDI